METGIAKRQNKSIDDSIHRFLFSVPLSPSHATGQRTGQHHKCNKFCDQRVVIGIIISLYCWVTSKLCREQSIDNNLCGTGCDSRININKNWFCWRRSLVSFSSRSRAKVFSRIFFPFVCQVNRSERKCSQKIVNFFSWCGLVWHRLSPIRSWMCRVVNLLSQSSNTVNSAEMHSILSNFNFKMCAAEEIAFPKNCEFSDFISMTGHVQWKSVVLINHMRTAKVCSDSIFSGNCTNSSIKVMSVALGDFWVSEVEWGGTWNRKFNLLFLFNISLVYVSPNGQTIREEFSAPPVKSPNLSPVLLNDYHFGQFRLKNNFLMESYFPSQANSNRPSFGCEFYIKGGAPMLDCRKWMARLTLNGLTFSAVSTETYENTTDHTISVSQRHESIATAVNEASAEHDRVKTRILDSENHYDESGNYIIKYVFDNGLAICEIGRVNHDDKTVTVYDGHIILDSHDFLTQWNYTADAKQYNVRQINGKTHLIDGMQCTVKWLMIHSQMIAAELYCPMDHIQSNNSHWNRPPNQCHIIRSCSGKLFRVSNGCWGGGFNWPNFNFSDGENRFEVYREFTEINGKPFVKATIKCNIESLGEMRFDINEAYAYGDTRKLNSSERSTHSINDLTKIHSRDRYHR